MFQRYVSEFDFLFVSSSYPCMCFNYIVFGRVHGTAMSTFLSELDPVSSGKRRVKTRRND